MKCRNADDVVQLEKHLVGHTKKDGDGVYIGRGFNGECMGDVEVGERGWLGNPYEVGKDGSREEVVEKFKVAFIERMREDDEFRSAVKGLAGKKLDCWCQERGDVRPDCHGVVIAVFAMWLATR